MYNRGMDANLQFLQNLVIALLLGSLIGVEREKDHHDNRHDNHEFGGIRTMSLVGMLGFLVYELFADNLVLLSVFTGAFLILLTVSYVISSLLNKNSGATTEIAAIFVYLTGLLVARGQLLFAASVTLVVVLLLYFKEKLHGFANKVAKIELYDAIKFIAVVFVVLPLLPNRNFGPLESINPYMIWLIVVLISGISFLSYVAVKMLGAKRGIALSGFFGGLISSTATSVSFSELSHKSKKIVNPLVAGILIACAGMFFRVLVEVAFVNRLILPDLLPSLLAMGFLGFLFAGYFWFVRKESADESYTDKDLNLKSPLQLGYAIQFALLLSALLFITTYVSKYYGNGGIYLTSFLTGLVDVDAIVVSMANLSLKGAVDQTTAVTAITLAVMTNTFSKALIVIFVASGKVGVKTMLSLLLVIAGGAVVLAI